MEQPGGRHVRRRHAAVADGDPPGLGGDECLDAQCQLRPGVPGAAGGRPLGHQGDPEVRAAVDEAAQRRGRAVARGVPGRGVGGVGPVQGCGRQVDHTDSR
ncbi:hypothetical protein GCM10025734_65250 [Kitasatospora paranensis]